MQRENSQLESEIEQLKPKLQILPELHQEHITQRQRKVSEEEGLCWGISKKPPKDGGQLWEDMVDELNEDTSFPREARTA